jgi:hypothetical protein
MSKSAHIVLRTHSVYITETDLGSILCFKYDDIRCDLESFRDRDLASDYIFEPFEDFNYYVHIEE